MDEKKEEETPFPLQIEHLRNTTMQLTARVNAMQSMMRATFAMMCAFDNRPELEKRIEESTFPLMYAIAAGRDYGPTNPQLAQWLRDEEIKVLKAECEFVIEQVKLMREATDPPMN